jgi:hypothetical protein
VLVETPGSTWKQSLRFTPPAAFSMLRPWNVMPPVAPVTSTPPLITAPYAVPALAAVTVPVAVRLMFAGPV